MEKWSLIPNLKLCFWKEFNNQVTEEMFRFKKKAIFFKEKIDRNQIEAELKIQINLEKWLTTPIKNAIKKIF